MPVFRSGPGEAADWCELEFFEIVNLAPGEERTFDRVGKKEKLVLSKGKCRIVWRGQTVAIDTYANVDLFTDDGEFTVRDVTESVELTRMCGRWGDEVGGSGLFSAIKPAELTQRGTPIDYAKETSFDNHYHDCDEYWIILEGGGTVVSEGKHFEVGPGDCVATGMGHHHDFPIVTEPVRAVYFETTMEGAKRRGHLWNQRDGEAAPVPERV